MAGPAAAAAALLPSSRAVASAGMHHRSASVGSPRTGRPFVDLARKQAHASAVVELLAPSPPGPLLFLLLLLLRRPVAAEPSGCSFFLGRRPSAARGFSLSSSFSQPGPLSVPLSGPPSPASRRPLPPPGRQQQKNRTSSSVVITRITNEGSELRLREGNPDDDGVELIELPDGTWGPRVALFKKYVDLGPQYQVPDPERGPLERRVSTQYLDGLFSDEVKPEDAEYWFSCPDGGWDSERKVLLKATQVDFPKAQQGLRPADEPSASTRRPLSSLKIGEILEGTVCGMALSTGIHVDVGSSYNGLLPVKSDRRVWNRPPSRGGLKGKLRMGDECRVRVAKIIDSPLCRFPLVLEVLNEPEIRNAFIPTAEYHGAFDLRGAPDAKSGLGGIELSEVMDSMTAGAWSGGAGYETLALPVTTGGARKGNVVRAAQHELGAEVHEWLERAGVEARARRAGQRRQEAESGGASSSPGGDDELEERESGGASAAAAAAFGENDDDDFESGVSASSRAAARGGVTGHFWSRRDEDADEPFPGLFLEEGVDHSDLDGAIAGLW